MTAVGITYFEKPSRDKNIDDCQKTGVQFQRIFLRIAEAPNVLFCKKKLFYSGYFAGKIDPVLCVAGKMKYICWETC